MAQPELQLQLTRSLRKWTRDWQRGQVSGCQLRWQGGAQLRKTVVDGRPGLTWGHDVLQYALRLLPLWNLPHKPFRETPHKQGFWEAQATRNACECLQLVRAPALGQLMDLEPAGIGLEL